MNYKDTLLMNKTNFEMRGNLNVKEPVLVEKWKNEKLYEEMNLNRKDAKESLSRQLDRSICNSERVASQLSDLIPDIVEKTAFENKLINGNGVLIRSLRQGIVEELSARIQSESTDIACCAREELDSLLKRCLDGRESLSAFSSSLTAAIVSRMDWKKLEKRILHKLQGLNIESIVDEGCRDLRDASHDFVVRKLLPDLRTGLTKISSEEIAEQIVCKLGLARRMSDLVMDFIRPSCRWRVRSLGFSG